jgi:hypothetical protein
MIRKSHDYDYLGAFFFLLFRFLFHFEGGVQQEDTTDLLFYYLFIFWAAKEYGRTSYAQSIRLCRSMPFFFYTRERNEWNGYTSKQGRDKSGKRDYFFSQSGFSHAERFFILSFFRSKFLSLFKG